MSSFEFQVTTDEGATFTPWTNGWAIGFKVTAEGQPDRYVLLNPSGGTGGDVMSSDVFVYLEEEPPTGEDVSGLDSPECFINIWDRPSIDRKETRS